MARSRCGQVRGRGRIRAVAGLPGPALVASVASVNPSLMRLFNRAPVSQGAATGVAVGLSELGAGIPSALEQLLSKGRARATLAMLGPAFVASIAYVDPGNFATNFAGGAAVRLPAAVGGAGRERHRDADPVPVGQAGDRDRPQPCRETPRAHFPGC